MNRGRHMAATVALAIAVLLAGTGARAEQAAAEPAVRPVETPSLAAEVQAGKLPPIAERLPAVPLVVQAAPGRELPGKPGGTIRMLMAKPQDTRLMTVYGYTRLVGYDTSLKLVPDLLEGIDVKDGREFTLHLRPGHRWSDGAPFTAEDFRYYWQDVANNKSLSPSGPPVVLRVDGKLPRFEILSPTTVRYSWDEPNPDFLPALAGASPLFIYRPAHYLKAFHEGYQPEDRLAALAAEARVRNWAALHNRKDNMYRNDNPDLPTLEPWMLATKPPADRFVFARNPYFHRIDTAGQQLPYADEVAMTLAAAQLIPAKTGAGESDLQARYLRFDNITFLKASEDRLDQRVYLWPEGKGSHIALYPNLNCSDPVWRKLFRDVRFRRALSLAVDRKEINQVVFYGLARPAADYVLPESPLYDAALAARWARFDPEEATRLLDDVGLARGRDGIRRLPDGRPAWIIVETAGESTEETDVLQLIQDTWREIGIRIFIKPMQREVFRNRVFSGETLMSVWTGLENGLATAEMSPSEIAPTAQLQLEWPRWGQFRETMGRAGEPPQSAEAARLLELYQQWHRSSDPSAREQIWREMLAIWADQVFTIGTVSGALQPVVVSGRLRNVPKKGVYSWDPGAQFGVYHPDSFWFASAPGGGG